jgi:predicted transcriptional regulator
MGPKDHAHEALQHVRRRESPVIPVIDDGILVGLLTQENIVDAIMVRAAARQFGGSRS